MAMHDGQGEAVPAEVGEGFWILRPVLFFDTADQSVGAETADGSPVGMGSGSPSVGLGAARAADAMGLTVQTLLNLNARGALRITNEVVPALSPRGRAMRFRVEYMDRFFQITSEREDL